MPGGDCSGQGGEWALGRPDAGERGLLPGGTQVCVDEPLSHCAFISISDGVKGL